VSAGPGHVERAITTAFRQHPRRSFTTEELAEIVYPGVNRVEKKYRVSAGQAGMRVDPATRWCGAVPAMK
jgi:hypothetical protein